MGPILFSIIYVNDLSSIFTNCQVIYTSTTQFIQTGDVNDIWSLMRRGEESMAKVKLYFNRNGLLLNGKKTQYMLAGTRGFLSQIPTNLHMMVGTRGLL